MDSNLKVRVYDGLERTKRWYGKSKRFLNGVFSGDMFRDREKEPANNGSNGFEGYTPKYDSQGRFRPSIFDEADAFDRVKAIRKEGLYSYFRPISKVTGDGTEVELEDGTKCIMFGSNCYSGLNKDPRAMQAAKDAIDRYGVGCAGSRFLNGNTIMHDLLERKVANFVGKEAALLFPTGYQANLGIAALIPRGSYVLSDKSNHASIVAATLMAFGKTLRFEHNNPASLERVLQRLPLSAEKLLVVDGVFSMEGDIAPLPEYCKLKEKYNFGILVDDAHAIGVIGRRLPSPFRNDGSGTAAHFGLTDEVDLIMGTFSKSYASIGGYLASDRQTITEYMRHHAGSQIFSASSSPGDVAAVLTTIDIIKSEPERIVRLWENTERMKSGLESLGFKLGKTETPILPIHIGGMYKTFELTKRLQQRGVFVNPVVSPGVPEGKEIIRMSLMATHKPEQIYYALQQLSIIGRDLAIIK